MSDSDTELLYTDFDSVLNQSIFKSESRRIRSSSSSSSDKDSSEDSDDEDKFSDQLDTEDTDKAKSLDPSKSVASSSKETPVVTSDSDKKPKKREKGENRRPRKARDWEKFFCKLRIEDGPPTLLEDDEIPEHLTDFTDLDTKLEYPVPMDEVINEKKAKEAKKKAEKDAKMKKFLEKKEKAKQSTTTAEDPSSSKNKEKEKEIKEKVSKSKGPSIQELLDGLEKVPTGNKKPTDLQLPDSYDPKYVESTWYPWWVNQGFFKPEYGMEEGSDIQTEVEKRGKFVIVIPPPNVTGTLHLGHALTCALEDSLTRWNRMKGKVTLWVPGCDHAGIATQMVVEKTLARKEGKTRHDLGREEFVKKIWEWKNEKGNRIYEQLKRLGISADWDRESFTMDPKLSKAVVAAFIELFESDYIYRADRLVNWSCTLKSCISDIEVDKTELTGKTLLSVPGYGKEKIEFGILTYFAYKIDENTEIVVATTRPETMLGDVAVAVNPADKRYESFVGKKAKHPFIPDREILIIADNFVDKEFGTGAVKITPAHDPNDYDCGKRNKLAFITVIDENGNMTNNCGQFSGMKRFHARKKVVEELKKLDLFREAKEHAMVVPVCSRSKDIVEPLLKPQWYVKCTEMAQQASSLVKEGQIRIFPEMYVKTWYRWMEDIRDWCISRQLWWGHQIPAYKIIVDGKKDISEEEMLDKKNWVAAATEEEALEKAKISFPEAKEIELVRDEDVLDTWFSSGLFPFSVFGWPDIEDNADLMAFFTTDLLETGTDILFFWVARMVFLSCKLTCQIPFKDIFLHSIIRDAHGRKMSKSLGNVIDPLDVIRGITLAELHKSLEEGNLDPKEIQKAKQGQKQDYPNGIPECGTDALRFALCACMTSGRDINLDVLRVQGYRFFCNKIWNAVKFSFYHFSLGEYKPSPKNPLETNPNPEKFNRMDRWIIGKLGIAIKVCNEGLEKYKFQEATNAIYNFWLYELCDVYLESLKPKFYGLKPGMVVNPDQQLHLDVLLFCIETALRLLSPFMPFLTEELWQRLPVFAEEKRADSICVSNYPESKIFEEFQSDQTEKEVSLMNHIIHAIRSTRASYSLPNKIKNETCIVLNDDIKSAIIEEQDTICALSNTECLKFLNSKEEVPVGCAASVVSENCTAFLLLKGLVNFEKEEERIKKQFQSVESLKIKLNEAMNIPNYEDKVPQEIQDANAQKLNAMEQEIKQLAEALESVKLLIG